MENQFLSIIITLIISLVIGYIAHYIAAKKCAKKVGDFKSIDEAILENKKIFDEAIIEHEKSLDDKKMELANLTTSVNESAANLMQLKKDSQDIFTLRDRADELSKIVESRNEELKSTQDIYDELQELKRELDLYSRIEDFVDYGLFEEPEYLFETSERYTIEIKEIRDQQKKMISNKTAIYIPYESIRVNGSSKNADSI